MRVVYLGGLELLPLSRAVESRLTRGDRDNGRLEDAEAAINDVARAFGNLCEHLADKKILTLEEVLDIADLSEDWKEGTEE